MVIEVFDEVIIAPAKCGTRWLSKGLKNKKSWLSMFPHFEKSDWLNAQWIIVREPIEHLKSAIHTEILPVIEDRDKIQKVLDSFISVWGGTHFHPYMYQTIMRIGISLQKEWKPIHLSKVSEFIKEYSGLDIPYIKDEYVFNHVDGWKSKEECVDMIKTEFPNHWKTLMELCKSDTIVYDKFINGEFGNRNLI